MDVSDDMDPSTSQSKMKPIVGCRSDRLPIVKSFDSSSVKMSIAPELPLISARKIRLPIRRQAGAPGAERWQHRAGRMKQRPMAPSHRHPNGAFVCVLISSTKFLFRIGNWRRRFLMRRCRLAPASNQAGCCALHHVLIYLTQEALS